MSKDTHANSVLENEISDWLVELIENDKLYSSIRGKREIETLAGITGQRSFIPSFTIDYISRMTCATAAAHVLSQLQGLEIIAVNKSISAQVGQILKPDIIAFNPETRTIVIFEIKRDVLTERQAVTELMAYEQEVQNNFPFLANLDLCFVVVARHWSTLMDHAVGSMVTWSDKQCLAIALDLDTQPRELSCHLPSAWSLLGSVGVPTDAIQAVDLVLYQSAVAAAELPPQTIFTAAQMIARNGDRANSHGFLMLWRDHAGFADSRWIITVCAFDPVIFFFHSRREGNPLPQRESELSAFIESRADDLMHGFLPSSAIKIAEEAIEILKPEFSPHWESFTTWHQKLEDHKARAFPVYFEFWGKPGEYIRQLVAHPDVRNNLMPYIKANALDWTCPEVAIPVIEEISGRRPLSGGVVKCSDAFELGEVLQRLLFLYQNMPEDESEPLHAYTRWIELRALSFMKEMAQIYNAAEEMNVPPPPLSMRPENRMQATQDLATWIEEHLIGGENAIHRLCFTIGCYCALFLDVRLAAVAESEQAQEYKSEAADRLRTLLSCIIATYEQMRSAKSISDDQAQHYSKIEAILLEKAEIDLTKEKAVEENLESIDAGTLIGKAVEIILPAADAFFPVVFYSAIDIAPIDIDWKWIKEGVQSMFDAGAKRPAVTLDMSGHIGTLKLEGQFYGVLAEISDPAVEVYFLDQKAGHSMAVKMTWDQLMAVLSTKTLIRE